MSDVINEILSTRRASHGSFIDNANVSQELKNILRGSSSYGRMSNVNKEAIDMICLKLSRAATGDACFADHWLDIAGYARLGGALCESSRPIPFGTIHGPQCMAVLSREFARGPQNVSSVTRSATMRIVNNLSAIVADNYDNKFFWVNIEAEAGRVLALGAGD